MKKTIALAMMLTLGSATRGLEVKMNEKNVDGGAKSVKCSLITNNVNYQLAFKTTSKHGKLFINGIGLLGGTKHYSKRGWWSGDAGGFFQLNPWGKNIFDLPVTYKTNKDGIVFTFKDGENCATIAFKARENDDKLAMQIKLSKTSENTVLKLICYPGDFMLKGTVKRNRFADTAKREIQWSKPRRKVRLEKNENWIYYEDKNFDTSKNSYYSTCAILYNPTEVEYVDLTVENYVIRTDIALSSKTTNYNFILWEFPGRENGKCLELMKSLKINK